MQRNWCSGLVAATVVLAAVGPALAADGDAPDAERLAELERRNRQLEERVATLEKSGLREAVDEYLEAAGPVAGEPLLPGGLALRITGEIRIREEIRDRLYAPGDPGGAASFEFTHMRTRLRFDVDVVERVAVVIEFQDVRNLGEAGSTIADAEGVDLKRGTIVFSELVDGAVGVELGRFVMHYGDQRLIGHLEWFDQGRTYDGLRVQVRPRESEAWVDAFGIRVRETVTPDDDQWLVGVYGGRAWLEAYVLLLVDQMAMAGELGTDDTAFTTLGLRIARATDGWDYSAEAAFQVGDLRGDDLAAFAFAVVLGRTFEDVRGRPRVGIEVAWASGDESPVDGDAGQFQTLFPTNHLHYGFADLVGWSNILDLRVRLSAAPRENVVVTLDYHHFRRPEDAGAWVNAGGAVVRPGAAGVSGHLGDEVDLTLTWTPTKPVSFLVGYSIFVPGGFVEDTGADPLAHFFYLQTRVKF